MIHVTLSLSKKYSLKPIADHLKQENFGICDLENDIHVLFHVGAGSYTCTSSSQSYLETCFVRANKINEHV